MKNNTPLVSIIIPVYNTPDEYLWPSLESIRRQTYDNLEIIIVDDGSRDILSKKLDKYIEKIDNTANSSQKWTIIHQKNSGLSSARNSGYKKASGKYIQFLDSDDLFDKMLITEAVRLAESTNADIVIENFGIKNISDKSQIESVVNISIIPKKSLFSLKDIVSDSRIGAIPYNVWSKLFKKEFLDNKKIIHNKKLHRCEDVLFSYTALIQSDRITFLEKPYILYYEAIPTSNTARNDKYPLDSVTAWRGLYKLLIDKKAQDIFRESFEIAMTMSIYWHLERMHTEEDVKKLSEAFISLSNDIGLNIYSSERVGIIIASHDVGLWRVYSEDKKNKDDNLIKLHQNIKALESPGIKTSIKMLLLALKRRISKQ